MYTKYILSTEITPLANGKCPVQLYVGRQLRTMLHSLKSNPREVICLFENINSTLKFCLLITLVNKTEIEDSYRAFGASTVLCSPQ